MTAIFEGIARTTVNFSDGNMMPLQEIAKLICDYAVKRAHAPGAPSKDSLTLEESFQDSAFLQRFRVGLAHGVASVLAIYDQRVLSVHLFSETALEPNEVDAPALSDVTVRLLVLVSARSAALNALAAALDQALLREVRELPALHMREHETFLSPTFITEEDVRQRKGFGVLFSSAYAPLHTIWKRDEGE